MHICARLMVFYVLLYAGDALCMRMPHFVCISSLKTKIVKMEFTGPMLSNFTCNKNTAESACAVLGRADVMLEQYNTLAHVKDIAFSITSYTPPETYRPCKTGFTNSLPPAWASTI